MINNSYKFENNLCIEGLKVKNILFIIKKKVTDLFE
jgi:hypothetical protein